MWSLSWHDIEYACLLEMKSEPPLRNLAARGLLNVARLDSPEFERMFRFKKADFDYVYSCLMTPDKIVSVQHVRVPGHEVLCMTLRRLAYPNRMADLEMMFNRHLSVISGVVNKVLAHVEYHFGNLLPDLTTHTWLNLDSLERFSEVTPSRTAGDSSMEQPAEFVGQRRSNKNTFEATRGAISLRMDELVLLHDDFQPRQTWKTGRIVQVFPGQDGHTRSCLVRLSGGTTVRRPIQLLMLKIPREQFGFPPKQTPDDRRKAHRSGKITSEQLPQEDAPAACQTKREGRMPGPGARPRCVTAGRRLVCRRRGGGGRWRVWTGAGCGRGSEA
ncbi:hypothetical protein HPB48_000454 [Haemaphysalis longicornis]|uniref:DUF5641 domain-containing protein n=1 Tax=Haemaphysalis longicornis TaxID=44386 RepID=A0A9J6G8T0_HAELO|nr:hypothetical protein HPB48_000454 [Haemaphysalis longicornis]